MGPVGDMVSTGASGEFWIFIRGRYVAQTGSGTVFSVHVFRASNKYAFKGRWEVDGSSVVFCRIAEVGTPISHPYIRVVKAGIGGEGALKRGLHHVGADHYFGKRLRKNGLSP